MGMVSLYFSDSKKAPSLASSVPVYLACLLVSEAEATFSVFSFIDTNFSQPHLYCLL